MSEQINKCDFRLKKKYEGLTVNGNQTVHNRNITNESAVELLKVHAPEKIFDKFPDAEAIEQIKKDLEATTAEVTTNADTLKAEGLSLSKATRDQLIAFAQKHNVSVEVKDETTKAVIVDAIKAWALLPITQEVLTPADVDTTNQQFATADNFDVETATAEQKADFIEKYNIPFEADKAYTEEETNELIKNWLAQDTLA